MEVQRGAKWFWFWSRNKKGQREGGAGGALDGWQ